MDAKLFVERVQAKIAAMEQDNAAELAKATPEEKSALHSVFNKKAKHAVKEEERADALNLVLTTIKGIASDDQDLMAAVKLLTKGVRAPRVATEKAAAAPRVKKTDMLDTLFTAIGSTCDENTIFAQYKLGRPDFSRVLRHQIKDAKDPAERKWIDFNPETGIYTYLAQGATPPEGWTGYTPKADAPLPAIESGNTPATSPVEERLF